jgi:membrane-associated phospholipid phosphatase
VNGVEATIGARRKRRLLALTITELLSPAVLVATISVIVAWHSGSMLWGLIAAVFASGIPLTYIIRGIRRGTFENHHVDARERRPAVLVFAAGSVVVGLALMVYLDAPRELVALVVAMLAGLALTLTVTHFWKVSFHSAVAGGTATILVLVFGPWWLVSFLAVAAIGWSRIFLRSHTLSQVVVGVALGVFAAGVVFPLLA